MQQFEYRVVPAPKRGEKAKGLKTAEERFAQALMRVMNEQGRDGWEYLRADTLPCEERAGLTGKTTVFQNMLVFRRVLAPVAPPPVAVFRTAEPVKAPEVKAPELKAPEPTPAAATPAPAPAPTEG